MPTADEHRGEALALSSLLDTLRTVRTALVADRDDLGTRGGTALLAAWSIDASVDQVDRLGTVVAALVDELQRRAASCDQYTADLRRHEIAHRQWRTEQLRGVAGPEPHRPKPPFRGAVAG